MELRGRVAPDDPPTTTDRSAIGRLPIDHQFSIEPDGEIFSRQCLTVPPTWLPPTFKVHAALLEGLGPLYFKRLSSLSRGLIRVRERAGEIRFEVKWLGVPLLIFAPAIQTEEAAGGHLCYTIVGGLMNGAVGSQQGHLCLTLSLMREGLQVCMVIKGYRSRLVGRGHPLRRWVYTHTQAALHHWIARDFVRSVALAILSGAGAERGDAREG